MRAKPGSGSFSCRAQNEESTIDDDGKKTCLTPSATDIVNHAVSDPLPGSGPRTGSVSTWAMLIKRVYEVDPLECPHCGGRMKIVGFIERRQHACVERILRHGGLWEGPLRTLASPRAPPSARRAAGTARDLELVPDAEFLESQRRESQSTQSRELQWVLDPEYL